MAGLFGGGGNTVKTPKYTEINLQTSAQGVPIPIVYGQNRIGTNIIWYNGFNARTTKVGGKGGILGGGAKEYYYSADVILALCEGPIYNVLQVWAGVTITTLSALGFSLFNGSKTQTPWDYVVSKYPTQALSYAQTAYVAAADYQLGTSPDLPSHNFEIVGFFSGTVSGIPDANFADIIPDFLTNPQYSIGMNAGALNAADLANYRIYTAAAGIFGSPALVNQEQANQTIQRWAQLTNTWIFWSGNNLRFIPLGDSTLTGNGETYTPQLTPVYNLGYDDFVVSQPGDSPVQVDFVDPADGFDRVQLNILDRSNYYNNVPILWEDQTTVDELGQLQANVISATEICSQAIGQICAVLIGKRSVYVNRTYTFKLSRRFIFIEPGDIYTITDPNLGLNQFQVRITGVKSGTDRILTVTAENLPQGVGTAAAYSYQSAAAQPPYNPIVTPGNVNPPAIFEPNAALTGGEAQVWIGASGGANWGGAEVWLSFDGTNYNQVGTIGAGLLQGTLISSLASHADPDTSDTLSVDLTESNGVLPSTATQADADALRTLILVDTEVMSYGTAQPGTLNAYSTNLTYLRRGQYGTGIGSHSAGAEFTRLDEDYIFIYGLPQNYVGDTLSIKLASFNVFGGEVQDLSTLSAYTYVPVGTAFTLAAPGTPVITPSSDTQADGTTILTLSGIWTASAGPLVGSYEAQWSTNGGSTWTNDQTVGIGAGGVVLAPALASTNYLLRVRAISQNGTAYSAWSTSASTNSGSLVPGVPAAPTGIGATAGPGSATVTWVPSSSASTRGYQVSYGTTNVFSAATLYAVTTSGTGLQVTGLTAGTLYYFWVQAFNGAGASSPDGPVSATPSTTGAVVATEGTISLGGFGTLNVGSGLSGSVSGSGTLNLTGTGVTFIDGSSTLGGETTIFAGADISITSGSAGATINVVGAGSELAITNGSVSASNVATIVAGPNLALSLASGVPLSVVQKSVNANLGTTPTPGNTVVIILDVLGTGKSAPGAIANFAQLATYYNSYTGGAVYSQTYEAGNNYANTVSETSHYVCYELANCIGVDGYAAQGTVSGSTQSIAVTARTGNNYIYAIFPSNIGQTVSSTIPAGMTQDFVNSGGNCDWGGYIAGQSGNTSVGFTGSLNDGVVVCFVAQGSVAGAEVIDLDARISAVLNNGSTVSAAELVSPFGDIALSVSGNTLNIDQGPIQLSAQTISNTCTIPPYTNGVSRGNVTIAAGCTVFVGTGGTWFVDPPNAWGH